MIIRKLIILSVQEFAAYPSEDETHVKQYSSLIIYFLFKKAGFQSLIEIKNKVNADTWAIFELKNEYEQIAN